MTVVKNKLLLNLDKLHTTELGILRIKKNLSLETNDVVAWCKGIISKSDSVIMEKGKNYYISMADYVITVNSASYTIITAHIKN